MKVILITGASSGIGHKTAKMLAQQDYKVYGGARRIDRMEDLKSFGVIPLELDVTDEQSAKSVVDTIIANEGKIDILVNNAGYGSYGPIEVVSLEEAKRQMEVNVFGIARMCQLVLPYMRNQQSGRIINVSSVGGRVTSFLGGWYHASKYAVEALSDSLRMDVGRFGIDVAIIEPAGVASEWGVITAEHLEKATKGTDYEKTALKVASTYRNLYSKKSTTVASTDIAAKKIEKAIKSKKPKARYLFGMGAKPMVFMHSILPARVFDKMMISMYK